MKTATEKKSGFGDRLRYLFDNSMSSGTPALIAWLLAGTLLLILVFAAILTIFQLGKGDFEHNFFEQLFYNLLHALDPGTIGGDEGSWPFLLTLLALTLGGLFIVSALIGVLANGIDAKLADLRRGRSIVLENEHTVILGWSESIFTIINELDAGQREPQGPGHRDPRRPRQGRHGGGAPGKVTDRARHPGGVPVRLSDGHRRPADEQPDTARSVIVLAPDSEDPDSEVIKTSARADPRRRRRSTIVAEIQDPDNLEAARLVGSQRTTLPRHPRDGRQAGRPDLAPVGGCRRLHRAVRLRGRRVLLLRGPRPRRVTYAEAQLAFEAASVVGYIDGGVSKLNPPPGTVLTAEQTLIVVVEDDSALEGQSRSLTEPALNRLGEQLASDTHPTQALLIGWNDRAPIVVRELDRYAPPGSSLTVLTSYGEPDLPEMTNLTVTVVKAQSTARAVLNQHVLADLDQVIVLCYPTDLDVADRRLAHAGDPAARARHPRQGRRGRARGQRDARRPQPGARLGRRRRRRRRERRDRQPRGHPAVRGRPARARSSRSCWARTGARSTCARPAGTSSPARTSAGRRWSRARPAAARRRSA